MSSLPTKPWAPFRLAFWAATALTLLAAGIALGISVDRGIVPGRLIVDAVVRHFPGTKQPQPTPTVPDSARGELALFVLAGQSNMVGQGVLRPVDRKPIPGAWLFGNDYHWKPARAPLDDPTEQVDLVSRDPQAGVGPGLFFVKRLRFQQPHRPIGVIPCAKGGSSIIEWMPDRSDATLYGSCLKRVRAASIMGTLEGLLFYQGETDALARENAGVPLRPTQWGEMFKTIVQHWRQDTGSPQLPVVFAQIGSHQGFSSRFPNWTVVQSEQAAVDLPKTQMVKTKDLPLRDRVHLSRTGYRTLGQRMMDAWIGVVRDTIRTAQNRVDRR